MRTRLIIFSLMVTFVVLWARGAFPQTRCMEIDSSQNNLTYPADYKTAKLGTLGSIVKRGHGPQSMILIPGLGFGADVFESFIAEREDAFTIYAVTLPGFGGTAAPPMPPEGTSFGEQTWTKGALSAIESMIDDEGITNAIVVGHWMTGTQLALRLALDHPENIRGVVIISGSAKFMSTDTTRMPNPPTLEYRIAAIDRYMAPKWYKMVTRETWDDNNFLPGDYSQHPVRALQLWRKAAEPTLPVWVRYLCEFYAQDITLELPKLKVPTLIIKPGFDDGLYYDKGNNYMVSYCHGSWNGVAETNPNIRIITIDNTRLFITHDQPEKLATAMRSFIDSLP